MAQIQRRRFLTGTVALLASQLTRAQQPGRTYIVGALPGGSAESTRAYRSTLAARLATHGFVEGRNLRIEYRYTDLSFSSAERATQELLALKPDAIFTLHGHILAKGAQQATKSVPIVFIWVTDPVRSGLVETLARPGGNATGVSERLSHLFEKRLELACEIAPGAKHVAVLGATYESWYQDDFRPALIAAARKAKVELIEISAYPDGVGVDFARGVELAKKQGVQVALMGWYLSRLGMRRHLERAIARSLEVRLPLVCLDAEDVEAGGLVSYGVEVLESVRLGADQLARVLKGANPATLAVDQAARFELAVNLKTSNSIGLTIPSSVLLRATRVIE